MLLNVKNRCKYEKPGHHFHNKSIICSIVFYSAIMITLTTMAAKTTIITNE